MRRALPEGDHDARSDRGCSGRDMRSGVASVGYAAEPDSGTAELESLLETPSLRSSKYQQSAADAPAAVTIITQGEIRAFWLAHACGSAECRAWRIHTQ